MPSLTLEFGSRCMGRQGRSKSARLMFHSGWDPWLLHHATLTSLVATAMATSCFWTLLDASGPSQKQTELSSRAGGSITSPWGRTDPLNSLWSYLQSDLSHPTFVRLLWQLLWPCSVANGHPSLFSCTDKVRLNPSNCISNLVVRVPRNFS